MFEESVKFWLPIGLAVVALWAIVFLAVEFG